jgi:hypothetical protein
MLHFLRRIRRSLINTGATRKYLLYAVGEIALVMIGILLALQVNNWNEGNKESIRNGDFIPTAQEVKSFPFFISFPSDQHIFTTKAVLHFPR